MVRVRSLRRHGDIRGRRDAQVTRRSHRDAAAAWDRFNGTGVTGLGSGLLLVPRFRQASTDDLAARATGETSSRSWADLGASSPLDTSDERCTMAAIIETGSQQATESAMTRIAAPRLP